MVADKRMFFTPADRQAAKSQLEQPDGWSARCKVHFSVVPASLGVKMTA
jgi:hypothetical protein